MIFFKNIPLGEGGSLSDGEGGGVEQ